MTEKNKKITIGLTGNICSGKSTVLKMFEELGSIVISSDEFAHKVLDEDEDIKKKVTKYFATTDRSRLAEIVFSDCRKRVLLETILHPAITEMITMELDKIEGKKVVVIEIPLLFETGWDKKVDYVVFVSCPTAIRKDRFCKNRKASIGDFECRDSAQMRESKKTKNANYTIDNSGDMNKTALQIKSIMKALTTP